MSKATEQHREEGRDDLDWQFRGSREQYPISFVDNLPTEAELEEVGLLAACEGEGRNNDPCSKERLQRRSTPSHVLTACQRLSCKGVPYSCISFLQGRSELLLALDLSVFWAVLWLAGTLRPPCKRWTWRLCVEHSCVGFAAANLG